MDIKAKSCVLGQLTVSKIPKRDPFIKFAVGLEHNLFGEDRVRDQLAAMVQEALNLDTPGSEGQLLLLFRGIVFVPFKVISLEIVVEAEVGEGRVNVNLTLGR